MICAHCGQSLYDTEKGGMLHDTGRNAGLQSCWVGDTNLPYGYRAHPAGTPCPPHCLGSRP